MDAAIAELLIPIAIGAATGWFFFGSLWLVVRHMRQAARPVLLLVAAGVVRYLVAAGAFYLAMAGEWHRALLCLAGFLLARAAMLLRSRSWRTA